MKDYKTTPVTIAHQGAMWVDKHGPVEAVITHQHEDMVLLSVDCTTKRGEVFASSERKGIPGVYLHTVEGSLHLHPDWEKDPSEPTLITFPEFKDWEVRMGVWDGRYSFSVLLIKPTT